MTACRVSHPRARAVAPAMLGATLLLAACGSDDGASPPPAFDGRWELVAADGEPPPRLLRSDFRGDFYIVGASLEFRSRGRVTDTRSYDSFDSAGNFLASSTEEAVVAYVRRGDSLFVSRAPAASGSVEVDTGVVSGSTIVLRVHSASQFARVPVTLTLLRDP